MKDKVHVRLRDISKTYGDKTCALKNINLDVMEGEVLVLLGPSGCGKSTLLRIIGGLHSQSSGSIHFYDQEISHLPPEKRGCGFVFQSYALFPTMTVRENIAFGLKIRKMPKRQIQEKVDSLLQMVNLTALADRKPAQLSGGEQQRVAIARVLAIEPKVLLMDEPLTALDAKLKEHLKIELSSLFRRLGITTIYVTHDQDEAMFMADRIAIINKGIIEQVGSPKQIYSAPATDFVAQFIGKINRVPGRLDGKGHLDLGFIQLDYPSAHPAGPVESYLRPEALNLAEEDDPVTFEASVCQSIYLGKAQVLLVEAAGQIMQMEVDGAAAAPIGARLRLKLDASKVYIF